MTDDQFNAINRRFDAVDERLGRIEAKLELVKATCDRLEKGRSLAAGEPAAKPNRAAGMPIPVGDGQPWNRP